MLHLALYVSTDDCRGSARIGFLNALWRLVTHYQRLSAPALATVCLFLLASTHSFSMDEPAIADAPFKTPSLYSPFDEPRPRIPAEILSDKRLDRKVTICARNKNMRDLLQQISQLTGVQMTAARHISGERPIVYLHDRSLRDLMTEISGLYGYYWLVSGKKDAWTYQLFEDVIHSKRRDLVRESQDTDKAEALLDCVEMVYQAVRDKGGLDRLRQSNPRLYESVSDSGRVELIKVLGSLDRATLRGFLNDVGMVRKYADLAAPMQSGILTSINATLLRRAQEYDQGTDGKTAYEPWTEEQLRPSIVTIKRWRRDVFSAPHLVLKVSVPAKGKQAGASFVSIWPGYTQEEPELLTLPATPPGRVTGDPLPDLAITVRPTREQLYDGRVLIGDVLEALSQQAGLDAIADYYYQETSAGVYTGEPLSKLVTQVCSAMSYTCQVEGNTLRFRFNQWFLQPLPDEPSPKLQEFWWRKIIDTGGLSLDDLLDIACLPGDQTSWSGFRTIPQAWQARWFPRTARVVRVLGPVFESVACSPDGLPVAKLGVEQYNRIVDWAGVMGVKETEDLSGSVIRIEKSGSPTDSLKFMLILPGGESREVAMTAKLQPLNEKQRRILDSERKKELASDRTELSVSERKLPQHD